MNTEVIYFIQEGSDGPIKIGRTRNIVQRLDHLMNHNSRELAVRALMPGGVALEREIQARFGKHLVRGEWFHPHPEILEYIASIPDVLLRDLKFRRKYRKGLSLEDARKVWADPALTTTQARMMIGWSIGKVQALLGHKRPVDHQGRSSAVNGKEGGRPAYEPTMQELKDAKGIWRDTIEYPEWRDANEALKTKVNKKFTAWRAYDLWGPRTGKRR